MPTTSSAVGDKRRRHHAARAHGRGRSARKGSIGHKRYRQKRPLQSTRAASLLQGALNHKANDCQVTSRDSDEMRRSRHRKPIARRLSAQLGRAATDNAGYKGARRVSRRGYYRKQRVSQARQWPGMAIFDRYDPNGLDLTQLTAKHP